jgi:hypothetical protein
MVALRLRGSTTSRADLSTVALAKVEVLGEVGSRS